MKAGRKMKKGFKKVAAFAASLAVERLGMPEARITLAQAASYIATAPKSNAAYLAIENAQHTLRETGNLPIPPHLQDAHYKSAAKLGHGLGYKYAHDYPDHYVKQQYLPYELNGKEFYSPSGNGYELKIKDHMRKLKNREDKDKCAGLGDDRH